MCEYREKLRKVYTAGAFLNERPKHSLHAFSVTCIYVSVMGLVFHCLFFLNECRIFLVSECLVKVSSSNRDEPGTDSLSWCLEQPLATTRQIRNYPIKFGSPVMRSVLTGLRKGVKISSTCHICVMRDFIHCRHKLSRTEHNSINVTWSTTS